jgi:putative thioredoxin
MKIHDSHSFDCNEHDFRERVLAASHSTPVLVDFWADWCGPCLALTPVLERVVAAFAGRVLLAKVEADENMRLAGHYRLRGFPTVLLFQGGEERARFTGAKPVHWVHEFLEQHLSQDA